MSAFLLTLCELTKRHDIRGRTMSSELEEFSRRFDIRWRFYHRIKESRKILELGCGAGINYSNLKEISFSAEYHGIDLVPPAEAPEGIRYTRLNLDDATLPYPDGAF